MKAIKLIFSAILLLTYPAIAQVKKMPGSGIQFVNKDWKMVLAMAKKTHKPIFVDAYTSWCAPCQEMKRYVFTDHGIAKTFNTRFINFTVDVEKNAGVFFAYRYQVNAYPTLLFIDGEGKVIKQMEGFMDVKTLAAFAADIRQYHE